MAIIRTIRLFGKTKRKPLVETLNKRRVKKKLEPFKKKEIHTKYKNYRRTANKIITHTEKMLEIYSKEPRLKNAEFVFLDRDAVPYMHVAKELAHTRGFKREQFKSGKITHKLEEYFSHYFRKFKISEGELISISSNGSQLKKISKEIQKISEIKNLGKIISKEVDLKKPIVVIDSGYNGTAVKKYQLLLKIISPNTPTYSSMFYTSDYATQYTDYVIIGNKDRIKHIGDVESVPKFTGKLLRTRTTNNKEIRITRQNREKPEVSLTGGFSDPETAEVFTLALRNQLALYKKKKGMF